MNAPVVPTRYGGSPFTLGLLVAAMALFGLVGGLPESTGPIVGVAGVVISAAWRGRRRATAGPIALAPALAALGALAVTAPAVPSTELFGSFAALATLLWLADDPARPAGGGRRAVPALSACAVGVALAWSLSLLLPRPSGEVGLAAVLLVGALLAVAWFLGREAGSRSPVAQTP